MACDEKEWDERKDGLGNDWELASSATRNMNEFEMIVCTEILFVVDVFK